MAVTPAFFRRSEIQKLLRAIRDGKIETIEPIFNYDDGVKYPALEEATGIFGEALNSMLNELSRADILTSKVHGNVVVCPTCGSHQLMVSLYCPTCGSPNLEKGVMLEHLVCGHLDLEKSFRRGEQLICPKCGGILKALGVDYRRPGILYKCLSCGGISPSPKKQYTCVGGHAFDENDLVLCEIRSYRLNPAKRAFIERETIDFKPILEDFISKGMRVRAPAILQGMSGVEHEFAFAIWADKNSSDKDQPDVLADVYTSEKEVDPISVLVFHAKTMDIPSKERVLIAMPGVDKKAEMLARSYNITVVEAESPSDLMGKTKNVLQDIARKREKEAIVAEAEALEAILKEMR